MLQVAGIHAYYVPVDDRRGFVDPELPSAFGNHMITAIEVPAEIKDDRLQALVKASNGKRYLIFDPTDERTPIGNLRSDLQGSYGLLVIGSESQAVQLPVLDPAANGTEREGSFKLAQDGTISGGVVASHTGPAGGILRYMLKETDEKERHDALEHEIGQQISGVSLDSYKFTEPEALDKPMKLQYEITAHQYAKAMGPLLLVRPHVLGEDSIAFDDKPRTVAIELGATGHWRDRYDIVLPDGFVVDELPNPVDLDVGFASYHSAFSAKDKTLHYEREYTVRQVELPPSKAAELRHLEGAIRSDELATAVLKKQ